MARNTQFHVMRMSCQLFKCLGLYPLKDVKNSPMQALDAHLYSKYFRKSILAIYTQKMPPIDIINDRLILPLFGIGKLHHAYRVTCAVESVEKLPFKLFPTID